MFRRNDGKPNQTKKKRKRKTSSFDVAEQGDTAQRPVSRVDVRLQVDGTDVGGRVAVGFAVNGTLVHLGVLAGRRLHGVDVDDRHRIVEGLRLGLHQFTVAPVQRRT